MLDYFLFCWTLFGSYLFSIFQLTVVVFLFKDISLSHSHRLELQDDRGGETPTSWTSSVPNEIARPTGTGYRSWCWPSHEGLLPWCPTWTSQRVLQVILASLILFVTFFLLLFFVEIMMWKKKLHVYAKWVSSSELAKTKQSSKV